ncbi:MAG TPA: NBR1-Ig-like domain-containing protein [Anaerolineae bacterium]|nr:NBR1-Ig-like domain-containing protein [Anaerolineae bacterium]
MTKPLTLCLVLTTILLIGLTPSPMQAAQFGGTQVTILNPTNGMTFSTGQTIGIASNSTAAGGISFVQLFVDNVGITTSSPPGGVPQSPFYVIQYWTTTPGYHTIMVRATSSQGVTGQSSIYINVGGAPPGPTRTPNPCVVGARFLGDVTVPDGTTIQPGTSFQKTWQVQNTGSCIWINMYGIQNVGGGSLGATSPSPLPYTQPGQTVNISVNMVAPQAQGTYTSYWQLRASNGALFGPQLHVQIIVPAAGCFGNPQISNFYASPQNIRQGQYTTLVWGPVYNSDQVRLQTPAGSSSVTAPGQLQLAPQLTTTYILTGFCKGQRVDAATMVNVSSPIPPTPTPPPQQNYINLQPAQAAGFGAINVPVQYFYNNQNAPGQIQLTAYNNFGQVVGSSTVGAIPFSPQYTNVTISIPSGYQNAVQVQGCITDRTGNPLACNTGLGIRSP